MRLVRRDLRRGEWRQQEATSRVLRNAGRAWTRAVLQGIRENWPMGAKLLGEDVRIDLVDRGYVRPPHHHNAWGAAVRVAVARGLLLPTGRRFKMKDENSHARKTDEYVRWGALH